MRGSDADRACSRKALKVDLVGGVGTGQANDAPDVELVLNLLHEEWHVTTPTSTPAAWFWRAPAHRGSRAAARISRRPDEVEKGLRRWRIRGAAHQTSQRPEGHGGNRRLSEGGGLQPGRPRGHEHLAGRGLAQTKDKILRNSAEWMRSGRVKLYLPDADPRFRSAGEGGHQPRGSWPSSAIRQVRSPKLRCRTSGN